MSDQLQVFVRGLDGNLWLETGPFGNVNKTIATRVQVDANVSNPYSQVGEHRIWRPGFQAINAGEIYVLGNDGHLWIEHAPFNSIPPSRTLVDVNVQTFQAIDLGTVFVLGTDGNLWLESAPFGQAPPSRKQIYGKVQAFQALDLNTVFVLGTDGNLWLETAPFDKESPSRKQIDSDVIQFWAMDLNTIYVLGSDLNLWYDTGPFGNVDLTVAKRTQIDANVNDFQAFRSSSETRSMQNGNSADVVFVLGHDGNLWLTEGPYEGINHTIQTRTFVDEHVVTFCALNSSNLFIIDGNQDLWYENTPFGSQNRQLVNGSVNACQPIIPPNQLLGHARIRPTMN